MVAPAMADKPAEIPFGPDVFLDVDPCTGVEHEITIFFDTFVHLGHPNNSVDRAIRTGWTDSGYELFAGNDIILENNNVFMSKFKDMWRHDDGRMFRARGVFVLNFNTGEVQVDNFSLTCVGGETIL
jgi:hypothetical protein